MMLALRMGRTLSELRREMSASEIMMWAEFDRFSPLGDERADIRAAQIVSAVYGAQGVKVPLNDALLQWEKEQTEGVSDPFYSGVIDMPAGHGHMTLEFSVSAWLVNDWYPTASISDLLVVVMKKATAGISIS